MNIHLNPKEEEIMQILWRLKKAFVKEIVAEMAKPRPPYTSVSTLVRKMQDRNLVGHDEFGKTHRYYPVLTKEGYRKQRFGNLFKNYFQGSPEQVVSFFLKEQKVSVDELEAILEQMKNKE